MRRVLLGVGLTVALVVAPAWGATTEVKVENYSFKPATITINQNDRVTWRFTGTDTNHSVTSDAGSAESFDSDPGNSAPFHAPGYTFSHDFKKPGRFTYHCKPHPYMQGTVVVRGGGGGDTTAPLVSGLKAKGGRKCRRKQRKCRNRNTRISFSLSEFAGVVIKFKRRRGRSPKPVARRLGAGPRRIRLSTRRVPRGRYKMTLVATDSAGNSSQPVTRRFRVR
jgi:plastocyanin